MCLILIAYNIHPKYKLILAANRDEFYDRPTAVADYWEDSPSVLAGRDLVHGGTWLGVTKNGRFACVTNYRDPNQKSGRLSRGNLVKDFLTSKISSETYLKEVEANAQDYSGFNLLVGEIVSEKSELFYFSNRGDGIKHLKTGVYGLSNHLLDSPWHKLQLAKKNFTDIVSAEKDIKNEKLFEILADKTRPSDENLPKTGIGLERERLVSSIFIESEIYGTRCSTLVLVDRKNHFEFVEKNYQTS